jgi:hypothetical protein
VNVQQVGKELSVKYVLEPPKLSNLICNKKNQAPAGLLIIFPVGSSS